MNFWLKFVLILQLFCVLFIELSECKNNKAKKGDRCDLRKFEDNLHIMFSSYATKNGRWPENEKEMEVFCKTTPKATKFVKNYADQCLKGLSKPLISVFAYNGRKTNQYFCSNNREKKKFIDKGVCGNKGKDGTIKCWNSVISTVEIVKNTTIEKDKLPSLCCVFWFLKDCVFDVYKKLYPNYCSKDNLDHVEQHINQMVMESFRIVCTEFENRDKCANYMIKLEKFEKDDVIHKYSTPFPTTFEILESL